MRSVERDPVPGKMCLNNKLLARVNSLSYSGYSLSWTYDADIPNRITKFIKTLGIIRSVMKPPLVQKHTVIKIYKILARPILAYGCEACTVPVGKIMKSESEQDKCGLWGVQQLKKVGPQTKGGNNTRIQGGTCVRVQRQTGRELERSCQQNGEKNDSETNSAVSALGRKTYL
jgi:hypothetical protein